MSLLHIILAMLSAGPVIQEAVTGTGPPLGCLESGEHFYFARWDETDYFDGDTIWVDSFPAGWSYLIRFAGVDTPELGAKDEDEKAAAYEAKAFTGDWLVERNGLILLYAEKPWGKYGRPICRIYGFECECLNDELVAAGLIKNE
jgi:endonuclease YncB( thermonuclease family)